LAEWILMSLAFGTGALAYALGAVGGAAMAFLWFPKLSRSAQGLLACLPAPSALALLTFGVMISGSGQEDYAVAIGVLFVLYVPSVVIGWPCAFLTLRALDRRVERAGVKAQEIFE